MRVHCVCYGVPFYAQVWSHYTRAMLRSLMVLPQRSDHHIMNNDMRSHQHASACSMEVRVRWLHNDIQIICARAAVVNNKRVHHRTQHTQTHTHARYTHTPFNRSRTRAGAISTTNNVAIIFLSQPLTRLSMLMVLWVPYAHIRGYDVRPAAAVFATTETARVRECVCRASASVREWIKQISRMYLRRVAHNGIRALGWSSVSISGGGVWCVCVCARPSDGCVCMLRWSESIASTHLLWYLRCTRTYARHWQIRAAVLVLARKLSACQFN